MTWPSGARCAVAFTFDFDAEEVWLAGDPDAASKPGLLSMGAYGANVGVPELLRLLDRRGLPATFFVPGRVAEMHPDRVRDIVAAGHEVGAHGYTHRSPTALSRAEEEDELVKTKAILEGFGTAVRGYRSPAWEFSVNTLELLAAHGIGYSTNLMDRLHPYRHPNGVVELPVQWLLDDAAHFWFSPDEWVKKISTPSEVREIWEEELLGIRDLGGLLRAHDAPAGDRPPVPAAVPRPLHGDGSGAGRRLGRRLCRHRRHRDRLVAAADELGQDLAQRVDRRRAVADPGVVRGPAVVEVDDRAVVDAVEHAPHDPVDLPLAPVDRVDVPQDAREAQAGADHAHPLGVLAVRRPDEPGGDPRGVGDDLLRAGQLLAQRALLEAAAVRVRVRVVSELVAGGDHAPQERLLAGDLVPEDEERPGPSVLGDQIGDRLGVRGRAVVEGER